MVDMEEMAEGALVVAVAALEAAALEVEEEASASRMQDFIALTRCRSHNLGNQVD